jgi:hypothetical protein
MEFLPLESTQMATALVLGLDNLALFLAPVVFMTISRDWTTIWLVGTLLAYMAIVVIYYMPESPKFLLSMGRYDAARRVFSLI